MLRLALKNVFAKRVRLFSTALSVMLGIAFLAGTLVFTDTIRRTFDDLFANVYRNTDTFVRSTTHVSMPFGADQRGRIPESVLAQVRQVDGVAQAEGVVQGYAQIVGSNGDALGRPGQGAPTLGMSYTPPPVGPWHLTTGSRPPGPGELVIDQASADKGHLHTGDTVTVLSQTGSHRFPLVGTARFGTADSPAGATIALFDLPTAQAVVVGHTGEVDAVMASARPGVDEATLTARVGAVLPKGVEAITGTQITSEVQSDVHDSMSFFDTFLMVFAVIGLVVACFTIYNTFQVIVTQRGKEMALLRAVGATRRQVLEAQLLEAVLVGLVASLVGLGAGVGVARLLKRMLMAFGIDIPAGGTVFQSRTAVVALVVGTLVTVLSAVAPSLRASRVPPLAALRDVASDRSSHSPRRLLEGGVVTGGGAAALLVGLATSEIRWVGLGAFLVFVGVFVLGPLIARPVVALVGAPVAHASGVTGELARENARRNPKRTARTGGALMVGVALVAAITIIAASAKDWIHDVWGAQFTGDFVVTTQSVGFGGLSPDVQAQLATLPEVGTATGIRSGVATVSPIDGSSYSDVVYTAVDPATAGRLFDIGMRAGTVAGLTDRGVLLDDGEAASRHLGVGDEIDFRFVNGKPVTLTVQGLYAEDALAGRFVISQALHEQSGADQFDLAVYLTKAAGVSDAAMRTAIESVTAPYANAKVQSRAEYVSDQAAQLDQLVNLMYGLLGLAVVIALFSIANTMALSIHERTHEIGLLRAVGMTRRQTRTTVRWEAVIVTLLGTGLGLVIGTFFGWSISVALRHEGLLTFTLPVPALAVVVALAVLGGIAAAARPARRAARLDVLRAIRAE
jgi:putative ABC transport system permease protein